MIKYALVREVVLSLDENGNERRVAVCYMQNYSDLDIRDELKITKKELLAIRKALKQKLLDAGCLG
jgi:uncharacterized protein YkvS